MKTLAPNNRRGTQPERSRSHIVALLLLVTIICLFGNKTLHAQGTAIRVETFAINPGGQVRIENALGSTRVESWNDSSVRIVAEKKSPANSVLDPSELMLMGIQNNIIVQCRQTTRTARIDLTIYAPRDCQLQLTGGALSVDINGSFSSVVVDTTGGNISYRIPSNDDARLVMRSVRGIVRSTVPLLAQERTGAQSLQGRLGGGTSPVFLNTQAGNITLTQGPPAYGTIARNTAGVTAPNAGGNYNQTDPQADSNHQNYSGQQRSSGPTFRPSSLPQTNQQDQYDNQDSNTASRPHQPSSNSSGSSSGNGSVIFAGGDRSDDAELTVTGGGPFIRPRQERRTESGNSGLKVRIIPSNTPLGSARDTGGSIYDQPDDRDAQMNNQSTGGSRSGSVDYGARGGNRTGNQSQQTYDPYDSRAGSIPSFDREPVASSGKRTTAPPTLRRPDEAARPDSPTPSSASRGEETDEEAIVLKSALVNLNVSVMNRAGATLSNLKKEDFQVFENGQPQNIEFFSPSTAPFNLVLVLDLSGSIKDKLDVVKSAALRFVEVVGPQDKIAVVTFTQDVRVVSQLTANRDELKRRIKAIERPEGGTAFYEALWFSLVDTLRGTGGQRNAIVVMTDGVDSSLDRYNPAPTRVSFNRLAERLEESDVMVFPVYLDTEYEEVFERGNSSSEVYAISRDQLQRVAELTGGQMFKAEKVGDLSGIYKQVASAIRTIYSVGYYPTNAERDGTYRRVRVNVNRTDTAVRTRKGYYAR